MFAAGHIAATLSTEKKTIKQRSRFPKNTKHLVGVEQRVGACRRRKCATKAAEIDAKTKKKPLIPTGSKPKELQKTPQESQLDAVVEQQTNKRAADGDLFGNTMHKTYEMNRSFFCNKHNAHSVRRSGLATRVRSARRATPDLRQTAESTMKNRSKLSVSYNPSVLDL